MGLTRKLWSTTSAGVGNFHVHPRFPPTDIGGNLGLIRKLWSTTSAGVGNIRVYPRFHPTDVKCNLGLTRKLWSTTVDVCTCIDLMPLACVVEQSGYVTSSYHSWIACPRCSTTKTNIKYCDVETLSIMADQHWPR